jgi:hypothetical protein
VNVTVIGTPGSISSEIAPFVRIINFADIVKDVSMTTSPGFER